ncbi:hypothetical protein ACOSP7_004930 [Xanthoceras sorbifolium]
MLRSCCDLSWVRLFFWLIRAGVLACGSHFGGGVWSWGFYYVFSVGAAVDLRSSASSTIGVVLGTINVVGIDCAGAGCAGCVGFVSTLNFVVSAGSSIAASASLGRGVGVSDVTTGKAAGVAVLEGATGVDAVSDVDVVAWLKGVAGAAVGFSGSLCDVGVKAGAAAAGEGFRCAGNAAGSAVFAVLKDNTGAAAELEDAVEVDFGGFEGAVDAVFPFAVVGVDFGGIEGAVSNDGLGGVVAAGYGDVGCAAFVVAAIASSGAAIHFF